MILLRVLFGSAHAFDERGRCRGVAHSAPSWLYAWFPPALPVRCPDSLILILPDIRTAAGTVYLDATAFDSTTTTYAGYATYHGFADAPAARRLAWITRFTRFSRTWPVLPHQQRSNTWFIGAFAQRLDAVLVV